MANKERNKRAARKARQRERAEHETLVAESTAAAKGSKKAAASAASKKTPVKVASSNNTGIVARTRNYFAAVRGEMRRVTWPGREELTNYSVAVVAMLIVFGLVVWLVDTGIVAGLAGFTSLGVQ